MVSSSEVGCICSLFLSNIWLRPMGIGDESVHGVIGFLGKWVPYLISYQLREASVHHAF